MRGGTWCQARRAMVRVVRMTSDQPIRPIQYRSYLEDEVVENRGNESGRANSPSHGAIRNDEAKDHA
jgi:hypothetical protein